MLVSSIGTFIVTSTRVRACRILAIVFIHEEKHVHLKLIASELTVVVVSIACLLTPVKKRMRRTTSFTTKVQVEGLAGEPTTLAALYIGDENLNQKKRTTAHHCHLNNKHSFSPRHALLQETRPVQEAEICVCNREERELCLGGGEAFARETHSNVYRTRGYSGVREVRGQAGEPRLAYERPLDVDEKFAIGEAYLKVEKTSHRRRCT